MLECVKSNISQKFGEDRLIIRTAQKSDLKSIVEVYNQAVLMKNATAHLSPVDFNSKLQWFEQHIPDKYPIFVAEVENKANHKVAGWISLSPYRKGREALRHTAEVSYYVHYDFRRKGIGTALLDYVIKQSPRYEIKTIFSIILEHNAASINLIKKFGFKEWGFLPGVADFGEREWGHFYFGLRVSG